MHDRNVTYDVVVVGGGSAGVAAAVGAARMGASTLLLEKNPYFGGAATHSSVLTYCGFFAQQDPLLQVVGGVGNELLERLRRYGVYREPYRNPRTGNVIVPLDSELTKLALDDLVLQHRVTPLLHCQVIEVERSGDCVSTVIGYDHAGKLRISAQAFVDASGDADLSALSGAEVVQGSPEGMVQASTLVMRIGGVHPSVSLDKSIFEQAIQKAKQEGYRHLSKERGMLLRLPKSGDVLAMFADEDVDALQSAQLTKAEISARKQAWEYMDVFCKYIPGFENAYLVQTGPAMGVRETRHVLGNYILSGEDVVNGIRHDDAVARGGWPIEIHRPGKPAEYLSIKNQAYYDIPLRSLTVRGFKNLWCAGRIISCDALAFASVRVMGTAFATGHAAGVAAAYYAATKKYDVTAIRQELIQQGASI
ncbi:FAD-dependent oxidoreductase [Alicyclobacillus sp. TC]|uniref:FAD-dependent oxidoreductase n=1 Tax=Alicyclobacillus sp. TC TaxID=2606450 RepID=UPI0019335DDC|nr:FAD-dependent oxidoreductase [Alicyclobacillus sp. TC]QRF24122.1 FAD-dependent oxidoreductase [Alicyclobacillus sp. TC]